MSTHTPGLENRLPGFLGDPNIIINRQVERCHRSANRAKGERKVPNSQSFPQNNNIHNFPSTFHLKKNQKQICHQGKKALARLHTLIALIYIYSRHLCSLEKIREVSYHSAGRVYHSTCVVRQVEKKANYWVLDLPQEWYFNGVEIQGFTFSLPSG